MSDQWGSAVAVPSMAVGVSIIPGVGTSMGVNSLGGMPVGSGLENKGDKKVAVRKLNETDAERESRMEKRRQRERAARQQETEEQKEQRRKKRREADHARMETLASRDANELLERKKKRREKDTARRNSMTNEQREAFNQKRRENHRKRKESLARGDPSSAPSLSGVHPSGVHPNPVSTALPPAVSIGGVDQVNIKYDAVAVPNTLSMMQVPAPVASVTAVNVNPLPNNI